MIPITKYHMLNDGMKEKFIKSFWNVIHSQLSSDTTEKKPRGYLFVFKNLCPKIDFYIPSIYKAKLRQMYIWRVKQTDYTIKNFTTKHI